MLIKGAAAIITGAGVGLGRSMAERLMKAGTRVSYILLITQLQLGVSHKMNENQSEFV